MAQVSDGGFCQNGPQIIFDDVHSLKQMNTANKQCDCEESTGLPLFIESDFSLTSPGLPDEILRFSRKIQASLNPFETPLISPLFCIYFSWREMKHRVTQVSPYLENFRTEIQTEQHIRS